MGKHNVGWLIPILLLAGCNRQDTETISKIARNVKDRATSVTGNLKTTAASSWSVAGDPDLVSRVAARIRWDQQLAGVPIEVAPTAKGVELTGRVQDLEQHRRALMLAQTTTGVDEVKDSLTEGGL
jgi:osmotically-inducible protein OsmY